MGQRPDSWLGSESFQKRTTPPPKPSGGGGVWGGPRAWRAPMGWPQDLPWTEHSLLLWPGLDAQPAGCRPFIALPSHVALRHWCRGSLE